MRRLTQALKNDIYAVTSNLVSIISFMNYFITCREIKCKIVNASVESLIIGIKKHLKDSRNPKHFYLESKL